MAVICNAAHECPVEKCYHKQPHNPNLGEFCGPSMTCSTSGIVSGCISVEGGKYKTVRRESCEHCKGRGYHEIEERHEVKDEKLNH